MGEELSAGGEISPEAEAKRELTEKEKEYLTMRAEQETEEENLAIGLATDEEQDYITHERYYRDRARKMLERRVD